MHGHGKYTIGGTGGRVVRVTSLADSGPGTLREAINLDYPRIIKFDVSGIITLEQIVFANNGFCTLDGTGNVCLRGAPLRICSPEWIVYNMRFRPGDLYANSAEGDGLSIAGINEVYNIYIDSCSLSWAQDETLSIWGGGECLYRPRNITITNCIIAEALAANDNGYGALVGYADNVSLINNVIAYNRGRSPFIENATGVELINNRIAYWTYEAVRVNGYCEMDIIGNTFTDNSDAVAPLQFAGDAAGKVHTADNSGLWYTYAKSAVKFQDDPVASSGDIELSDIAGALPIDTVDARILYNIENGLRPVADAWTINSQDDVGGWQKIMTTQTFWYGKVVIEKPARVSPGGEASSIVFKKDMVLKCDAEDGRWLRPVATSVWVAKDWLSNIYIVEEETDPPAEPPATGLILGAGSRFIIKDGGETLYESTADVPLRVVIE